MLSTARSLPHFTIKEIDDMFAKRPVVTGGPGYSVRDVLGEQWLTVMLPLATNVNDIYTVSYSDQWLKSNVKKAYHYLFKLLHLGVLSLSEFRAAITKTRNKTDDINTDPILLWYELVQVFGEDPEQYEITRAVKQSLDWWFFGMHMHINDGIYQHPFFAYNLSRLMGFLNTNRIVHPESLEYIIEIAMDWATLDYVNYSKKVLYEFVRWLATPTDIGYLMLQTYGAHVEQELMPVEAYDKLEILTSRHAEIAMYTTKYSYLFEGRRNGQPPVFTFNDNGDKIIRPDPNTMITDYQIIAEMGGIPLDTSDREKILEFYAEMKQGKKHFYPALPGLYTGHTSSVAYEDIDDNTPVIVYGNLQERTPFVIEDIRLSIGTTDGMETLHLVEDNGNDIPTSIEINAELIKILDSAGKNINSMQYDRILGDFTREEIQAFIASLETLPNLNPEEQKDFFLYRICYIILSLRGINDAIRSIGSNFMLLSSANKAIAIELFKDVVTMGLYFRRWKGPGHPFPYSKESTQDISVDPIVNVQNYIMKYRSIVDQPDHIITKILIAAPRYVLISGAAETNSFFPMFRLVIVGEECIRVASKSFICTGYRCLKSLGVTFSVGDEVFNINNMDFRIMLFTPEERIALLQRQLTAAVDSGNRANIRQIENELATLVPNYTRILR